VVVVHSALVDLMDAAELQAVIAHELGHLKCDHGVWLTVANLLSLGIEISPLVPQFVVSNVQDELLRWSRAAELTCDRAALIVAGDPKVVVSVLMKLSGGSPKLAKHAQRGRVSGPGAFVRRAERHAAGEFLEERADQAADAPSAGGKSARD
jgi:Zn-dependent protease with chaperone function